MAHGIRPCQPLGRHFALDAPSLLITRYGYHVQTMRGKTGVFFEFVFVQNGYDRSCMSIQDP